jgi:hypothetical protein
VDQLNETTESKLDPEIISPGEEILNLTTSDTTDDWSSVSEKAS